MLQAAWPAFRRGLVLPEDGREPTWLPVGARSPFLRRPPLLQDLRASYHGSHSHGPNDGRRFLGLRERVGCHLRGIPKPSRLPGLETGLDPEPPVEVMDAGRDMVVEGSQVTFATSLASRRFADLDQLKRAAGTGRLAWVMPVFASYDGTQIGYRVLGDGPPLVCLPGGPGRSAEYLGDLGGVSASRQLILLDPRGVGLSADPADPATLRADLLVRDVETLRAHLGLDRIDLLAHSAGAVLATLYAAAHPQRLSRLILVTPGLAAVGVGPTEEQVHAALARRAAEPWYPAALAAMDKIIAGDLSMETFEASRPFFYARWDNASRAHATAGVAPRHTAARKGFFAGAPLDPPSARAALRALTAPVLLYAGDLDPIATPTVVREAAPLLNHATVVTQPHVAHFPWIDDPAAFAATISSLPT